MFSFMTHTAPLWSEGGARAETAASALLALCRNVIDRPAELRYRRVPAMGAAFSSRIASCPGALAVIAACGFALQHYPDGDYYVMQRADPGLLQSIMRELEVGIETIATLRAKRQSMANEPNVSASVEASDDAESFFEERPPPSSARQRPTAARMTTDAERQLAARSIVHRIAAREQHSSGRRRRAGATLFAACVLAVGIGLGASSVMALLDDGD